MPALLERLFVRQIEEEYSMIKGFSAIIPADGPVLKLLQDSPYVEAIGE